MLNQSQNESAQTMIPNTNLIKAADSAVATVKEISDIKAFENMPSTYEDASTPRQNTNSDEENLQAEENFYICYHLTGGAKHPGRIVETPGLANIKPPRPTYRPHLPKEGKR